MYMESSTATISSLRPRNQILAFTAVSFLFYTVISIVLPIFSSIYIFAYLSTSTQEFSFIHSFKVPIVLSWISTFPFGPVYLYNHNMLTTNALPLVPLWVHNLNHITGGLVLFGLYKINCIPNFIVRLANKVITLYYRLNIPKNLNIVISNKISSRYEILILFGIHLLIFKILSFQIIGRRLSSGPVGLADYLMTVFHFPVTPFVLARKYWQPSSVPAASFFTVLIFNVAFWVFLIYFSRKNLGKGLKA
jgi:hypothetical protein